jgi:hypothetical protein
MHPCNLKSQIKFNKLNTLFKNLKLNVPSKFNPPSGLETPRIQSIYDEQGV